MSATSPLLTDLAGVARLANVRRPVASVWRTRFGSATDPFPSAVSEKGGRALFDVMSVAQWLARTEHGNNPDAVGDAAAAASPSGFDFADASHVAIVDSLLALRAASGESVGGFATEELERRAISADPDDSCLVTEVSAADEGWRHWADLLADAAYSPVEASRLLERRHRATTSSAGSSGPLDGTAEALLIALTRALTFDQAAELVIGVGMSPALVKELVEQVGDEIEVAVPSLSEGRSIRRRLLCAGLALPTLRAHAEIPRMYVERQPCGGARSASEILELIDELVLGMRDDDRAIMIAPAAVLIESISPTDAQTRTDVLRSGRVRAIVKLPAGLVTSAPREALALWILGRETGDIAIADRVTAVADLTGTALTPAVRTDLTSDLLAAIGSAQDVRSHAFRFARLRRTTSLLAARGAIVSGLGAPTSAIRPTRDLPALIDQARADLGDDAPPSAIAVGPGRAQPSAQVEELIAQRHLRLLPGSRIAADIISEAGLVVVDADDLDDPARIGDRRVAPLVFAAQHPSARLTVAGDVVFRTSPTARAWVDPDGSKVVAYPARVLRIDKADPGGLVPELVAADIAQSPGGPAAWRRWRLRRVQPHATTPLSAALSDLAARRESLSRRIEALDRFAELLSAGVVSGAVTLTDHAADAASEH